MFYVPGLIYTLGNITCDEHSSGSDENEVITVNKYESGFEDVKGEDGEKEDVEEDVEGEEEEDYDY